MAVMGEMCTAHDIYLLSFSVYLSCSIQVQTPVSYFFGCPLRTNIFFWRICKHQTFTKLMKIEGSSKSKVDDKHQQYCDGHNPFLWKKNLLNPGRRRAKNLPINDSICTIMIEECPGFRKIQAFFGLASSLACCCGFPGSACLSSSSFSPSLKNSMAVRSTTWVKGTN